MPKKKSEQQLKSMDPQMFIYLAATDKGFREKYFKNPQALSQDFAIAKQDLAAILKIDFEKLRLELGGIESGIVRDRRLRTDSCHDSHNSHGSGDHSSGNHSNGCKGMLNVLLSNQLMQVTRPR